MSEGRKLAPFALLRIFAIILAFGIITALPVLIWGQDIGIALDAAALVEQLRATGWAGLAGVLLIVSDIVLPVPATATMAALGILYGPIVGGLLGTLGSILAGSVGYGLCRALGPKAAERLAGHDGLEDARALFDRWGFWLVAFSRWVPVLPEAVAFLCGLIRAPFPRFVLALSCGAVPLGFVFATAGHLGQDAPIVIIVLCAVAPLALVAIVGRFARSKG